MPTEMPTSLKFAVWILAIFALGTLLHEAATIFLWITTTLLLVALLDPAAQFLKSRGNSILISSLALVIAATALSGGLVFLLGHFSRNAVLELEDSQKIFKSYYNQIDHRWQSFSDSLTHAVKTANPTATIGNDVTKVEVVESSPFGGEVRSTLVHSLGSAVTVFTFAILCPILCFFLLAERDSLAKVLATRFKNPSHGQEMWAKIVIATRAFFFGNLVLALVCYPVFALLFIAFSVPSAFTLAGLASFFNLVPFLGSVLAGLLPSLTLLGQGDQVLASLGLYACCILIHFAVANFVTPKVLGSKVDINATTSTIALIAWGELWGGLGLILAIPVTAAIKILFEYSSSEWLRWFAALMSENVDKALEPKETAKTLGPDYSQEISKSTS